MRVIPPSQFALELLKRYFEASGVRHITIAFFHDEAEIFTENYRIFFDYLYRKYIGFSVSMHPNTLLFYASLTPKYKDAYCHVRDAKEIKDPDEKARKIISITEECISKYNYFLEEATLYANIGDLQYASCHDCYNALAILKIFDKKVVLRNCRIRYRDALDDVVIRIDENTKIIELEPGNNEDIELLAEVI